MKETIIITVALFLSLSNLFGQSKKSTVHIKKVTSVNGVETTLDTVFSTDDTSLIHLNPNDITTIDIKSLGDEKAGTLKKVIIVSNAKGGSKESAKVELDKETEDKIEEAIEKLKTTSERVELNNISNDGRKIMIIKAGHDSLSNKLAALSSQLEILIVNVDKEEARKLKVDNASDELKVEELSFYPNPNNGKFDLSFSLKEKGNTIITILDVNGKMVYEKRLSDFTGKYHSEIDITTQPKGIYFVKVKQNDKVMVKKIVVN
jgi:flagellar biosynthesis/type III secretory pathway chaperone